MNELQEWCKKILPVVQAAANGEVIEFFGGDDEWIKKSTPHIKAGVEYRIKPRTIKIGDVEVPELMRAAPTIGDAVFTVEIDEGKLYGQTRWNGLEFVSRMLERGLLHDSKDGAIAHAKALIELTAK